MSITKKQSPNSSRINLSRLPKVIGKKEFKALSRRQRAVLIAKDTLEWIKVGAVRAGWGYMDLSVDKYENCRVVQLIDVETEATSPEAKKHYIKEGCYVCAKGALFFSQTMRLDNCSINDMRISINRGQNDAMSDVFTPDQFKDIERAFEGHQNEEDEEDEELIESIFASHYNHRIQRLIAVCINIIKNKGRFICPKTFPSNKDFFNYVVTYVNRSPKLKKIWNKAGGGK